MKKTIIAKKITCFILAIITLIALLPTTAMAAGDNIAADIERVYMEAKRAAGLNSFSGWCGAYVGHQLKVMGINKTFIGSNGNQAFDTYKGQKKTTGDFYIDAYPASTYSLKQALNKISDNGSKTVRNILVGFEKGAGEDGARFGHAVVIHQIGGGTVWFSESFGVNLNGKYYPEGSPISCSIQQFCAYYGSWTVYEGLIHFKTYMDLCEFYPSVRQVQVRKSTTFKSLPCSRGTASESGDIRKARNGEIVTVIGLFRNSVNNYWYAVKVDGKLCYLFAGDAARLNDRLPDNQYDSTTGYNLYKGNKLLVK